jgi:hypothetical protein
LRFELLSVKAIKLATLLEATLVLETHVLCDYFSNFIAQLSSAPLRAARKLLLENQLKKKKVMNESLIKLTVED